MDSAQLVHSCRSLAQVEREFRSLKTIDLKIRPIHPQLADRVRTHIFLCMLAYYLEWHMIEAWRAFLFADEDQQAKQHRDPVAPTKRSAKAEHKALTHTLDNGSPAHSLRTSFEELSTIVRNTCRTPTTAPDSPTFTIVTRPKTAYSSAHSSFSIPSARSQKPNSRNEINSRNYKRNPPERGGNLSLTFQTAGQSLTRLSRMREQCSNS